LSTSESDLLGAAPYKVRTIRVLNRFDGGVSEFPERVPRPVSVETEEPAIYGPEVDVYDVGVSRRTESHTKELHLTVANWELGQISAVDSTRNQTIEAELLPIRTALYQVQPAPLSAKERDHLGRYVLLQDLEQESL
jgi:hypothetical protein